MGTEKIQKKVVSVPRKASAKKGRVRKGNIDAINKALAIADKYNLDFNYLKQ